MTVTRNDVCAPRRQPAVKLRRRAWQVAGILMAVMLALGACGGSSDDESGSAGNSGGANMGTMTSANADPTQDADANTGSAASGAPTDTDFCSLVTKDEAETAVGGSVEEGTSVGEMQVLGLVGSCVYNGTDSTLGATTVVNIIMLGTTVPRSLFDTEILGDFAEGEQISGLGEVAFAAPGMVVVFDQGLVLTLQILAGQVPADTTVIVELLRTALDRAAALR